MSFPTAFPTHSSNLPRAVILTLGTTDGTILIRLHTTNNNLHVFATFISRNHFDTQFLWTNIRPNLLRSTPIFLIPLLHCYPIHPRAIGNSANSCPSS